MWSHPLWLSLWLSLGHSLALFRSPNLLTKSLLGSIGPSRGPQPNQSSKVLVQLFAALLRFVNFYWLGQSYCGPQWDTSFCGIRHTLDISCGAQWDTAAQLYISGRSGVFRWVRVGCEGDSCSLLGNWGSPLHGISGGLVLVMWYTSIKQTTSCKIPWLQGSLINTLQFASCFAKMWRFLRQIWRQ